MRSPSLRTLAIASAAALLAGYALAFFYAPLEAEGFIQKIFYLHVPLAVVALLGFVVAAVFAILHLRSDDPAWDARSYVAIHMSVIFGTGALLTGALWAKGQWGVWWEWREPTLVSYLIIFLLYATYYPLRYAIEDRDRQARYASVFAITAGAFVPLNFLAVRLAEPFIHPRTFSSTGGLPPEMLSVVTGNPASMGDEIAGVIANIHRCDGRWCEVSIESYRGYLQQKQLWGVYPEEIRKRFVEFFGV